MTNTTKYIIGGALFILACIGGGWYFSKGKTPTTPVSAPQEQQAPVVMATSTYATTTYSLVYRTDFLKNEQYRYEGFAPKKYISGVQFTVPMTMATGTNLSTDTGISIEQLPRAQKCTGDIFVVPNVTPQEITENGITYSVATSSDAGAGNFYEETVYALANSKPCTAVRYHIHSLNIGNFASSTVVEFDRMALLEAFDSVRSSLQSK